MTPWAAASDAMFAFSRAMTEETSICDRSVRRDSLARLPDSPAKTEALRRPNAG